MAFSALRTVFGIAILALLASSFIDPKFYRYHMRSVVVFAIAAVTRSLVLGCLVTMGLGWHPLPWARRRLAGAATRCGQHLLLNRCFETTVPTRLARPNCCRVRHATCRRGCRVRFVYLRETL